MKLYIDKLVGNNGFMNGSKEAVDTDCADIAIDYKKRISGNFSPINGEQISSKLEGSDFVVTRKIDGELQVVFFDGVEIWAVNGNGNVKYDLPCLNEMKELLSAKGVTQLICAAELHVDEKGVRKRVYDVMAALADKKEHDNLQLAIFDIIEKNNKPFQANHFKDVKKGISSLFDDGKSVSAIQSKSASSSMDVKRIYEEWVEKEEREGLVVHSEFSRIYKIKPKHTIDAVVVGYTEGDGENVGKIRDILFALIDEDNSYQIIGKTGGGFSEEEKKKFFNRLDGKQISSDYIEIDSRNIAYRMVNPDIVVEIGFSDILTENKNGPKENIILSSHKDSLNVKSSVHGVSLISPVFIRLRDDKQSDDVQTGLSQISGLVYLPTTLENSTSHDVPASEIILRKVFTKQVKKKTMVLKCVVWKTNKEGHDSSYLAYVMHFTNFSPNRKDSLKRDIRISSSETQIMKIADTFIEKNVKKGWEEVNE